MPQFNLTFDLRHPQEFPTSGPEQYSAALDIIEWADERGFRRVAVGEHHQSPDGYLPAPLVFAAAIGGRTKRIRVQISVLLAPLYDPVRLAEEIAVADLCLQGRLDPAVAVGYVEADFDMFGADYRNRGQMIEELIPFLRKAWTRAAFGEESGPYAGAGADDPLSGHGNYQILDPEEAIALANGLGRRGWMMINPLLAGIDPAEAWKMLHLLEERVFPYLEN